MSGAERGADGQRVHDDRLHRQDDRAGHQPQDEHRQPDEQSDRRGEAASRSPPAGRRTPPQRRRLTRVRRREGADRLTTRAPPGRPARPSPSTSICHGRRSRARCGDTAARPERVSRRRGVALAARPRRRGAATARHRAGSALPAGEVAVHCVGDRARALALGMTERVDRRPPARSDGSASTAISAPVATAIGTGGASRRRQPVPAALAPARPRRASFVPQMANGAGVITSAATPATSDTAAPARPIDLRNAEREDRQRDHRQRHRRGAEGDGPARVRIVVRTASGSPFGELLAEAGDEEERVVDRQAEPEPDHEVQREDVRP